MGNIEAGESWAPGSEQSRKVHEALGSRGVVFSTNSTEFRNERKGVHYTEDRYDIVVDEGIHPASLLSDIDGVNTRDAEPRFDEELGKWIPGRMTTFEITKPGISHPISPDSQSVITIGKEINLVRVNVLPNIQS